MSQITLALALAVTSAPHEYHIDCSGWTGAVVVEFSTKIVTLDGKVLNTTIEVQAGTEPDDVRDALWRRINGAGGRGFTVANGVIVLSVVKNSAIRSVEFTSKNKGWKPEVRLVLLKPEKK